MKVTIYRVGAEPEVRELEKKLTLAEMQELVGGYIQLMPWTREAKKPRPHWWMIADEDGRVRRLPINVAASEHVGYIVVGTAVVGDYPFS